MKTLGYATAAIGKWHLGYAPQFRPTNRGFDEFYGTLGNTPFFHPQLVNSSVGPDPERVHDPSFYATDAFAERAVDYIERHKAKPFFLYLPFNACHVPNQATDKYLSRFQQIENQERRGYAAMLSALDDAVGRVLETIRQLDLETRTLILFLSDNGGPMTKMGQNGSNNDPLKGQKGDTWEGAIRVPFFMQWNGRLPAGKLYDHPVIQLDILPTLIAAAGGTLGADWKLDGVDLLPFFNGQRTGPPHSTLFWRFGPQWAIRRGDWKPVQAYDYAAEQERQPHLAKVEATPKLFNLAQDIGERIDLSSQHPDKVRDLAAAWQAWNSELAPPAWVPNPPRNQPSAPPK